MEWLVVVMYLVLFAMPSDSDAAQSSVTVLHGDGYKTGDDTRNTFRVDTLAVKDWGMLYGRMDVTSFDDDNSNVFTRGIGHAGTGWHFAGQVQNQKGISQSQVGAGYSRFSKDTQYFVDLYKVNSNYYGDGISIFAYGSYNFTDSFKASGFVESLLSQKEPMLFTQSSLSYKLSDVWVGVEHHHYLNKNGIKGLEEAVDSLFLKWEF